MQPGYDSSVQDMEAGRTISAAEPWRGRSLLRQCCLYGGVALSFLWMIGCLVDLTKVENKMPFLPSLLTPVLMYTSAALMPEAPSRMSPVLLAFGAGTIAAGTIAGAREIWLLTESERAPIKLFRRSVALAGVVGSSGWLLYCFVLDTSYRGRVRCAWRRCVPSFLHGDEAYPGGTGTGKDRQAPSAAVCTIVHAASGAPNVTPVAAAAAAPPMLEPIATHTSRLLLDYAVESVVYPQEPSRIYVTCRGGEGSASNGAAASV